MVYTENIDVVVYSGVEQHYDDDYLRGKSYIIASETGKVNYDSIATLDIKSQATSIEINV